MYPTFTKLPERNSKGTYYILIITSGRILRWPYFANSSEPMYLTFTQAETILKAYLRFSNASNRTRVKRVIGEFEIVCKN